MNLKKVNIKFVLVSLSVAMIISFFFAGSLIASDNKFNENNNKEVVDTDEIEKNDISMELQNSIKDFFSTNMPGVSMSELKTVRVTTINGYKLSMEDLEFLQENMQGLLCMDVGDSEFESIEVFEAFREYFVEEKKVSFIYTDKEPKEESGYENQNVTSDTSLPPEYDKESYGTYSEKIENTVLKGLCILERGTYLDVGVAYDSTDPNIEFQWLQYDVKHQVWSQVSGRSKSNWTSWRPQETGNYWICVQAIDSTGKMTSYIYDYVWKGIITKLNGLCILDKGSYLDVGVAYDSTDPNIEFQWLQYNVKRQEWSRISEKSKSNWMTWKPKEIGNYWICVQAVDSLGKITTYIYEYTYKGFVTQITGIYMIDKGNGYDMGICYKSNDPNITFQWKIYDLKRQQWSLLQEKTSSNWTTWSPTEEGDYWIHAETIDSNGTVESYTLPFYFKGLKTELHEIGIIEKKNSIDIGVAYNSNDSALKFRWLLYDVEETKWSVISDWSSGNWTTWKPEKKGEYWFWVDAKSYDGKVKSLSYVYNVRNAKITNFNITPDSPNWIGANIHLSASYQDYLSEVVSTRFLIWNGIDWRVLPSEEKTAVWTPSELGQYLFCYELYGRDGKLIDQVFKPYNIERPYLNLNGIYVREDGNMRYSMAVAYDTNDREVQFRWLYYDVEKQTWNVLRDWNASNSADWNAPKYGNFWLHVEARLYNGDVKTYTIGYSVVQEPVDVRSMRLKANLYSSSTPYVVLVNRSTHKVGVFQGWQGNWQCLQYWDCSDGAASTPTVEGTFKVGSRGYYFDSGASRCYWYTQFYGNYLFHSVLYNKNGTLQDGRLGMALSHGCVRLNIQNAKWIYDTIPSGTTVVVYH